LDLLESYRVDTSTTYTNYHTMAEEDNNIERGRKRLRSSTAEPDLKVVVGAGDDTVTKWYYSQTLASKSKYIDTVLSTPMNESLTKTITFPDIQPNVWDKMMLFLDSPLAVRKMNTNDAVAIAVYYEKYGFTEGANLCDDILKEYFLSLEDSEATLSIDVNFLIGALVVAKDANLHCLKEGVRYIWKKMHSEDYPYGRTMFKESQMTTLATVLRHALSPEYKEKLGSENVLVKVRGVDVAFPFDQSVRIGWKGGGNVLCRTLDIDNPDFAKAFVTASTERSEELILHRCLKHVEITGVECSFEKVSHSGSLVSPECYVYKSTKTVTLGMQNYHLVITKIYRKKYRDWAIIRTRYVCYCSSSTCLYHMHSHRRTFLLQLAIRITHFRENSLDLQAELVQTKKFVG